MKQRNLIIAVSVLLCFLVGLLIFTLKGSSKSPPETIKEETDKVELQVKKANEKSVEKAAEGYFRVASIQMYSHMGKIKQNRKLIHKLILEAHKRRAQIIVLPEAAVTGYMNPSKNCVWNKSKTESKNEIELEKFAEKIPGESSLYFSKLCKELKIYLSLPLIEFKEGQYFNSVILISDEGEIVSQHQKINLWPPGDATWASVGQKELAIADTPFGKVGSMICFDAHKLTDKYIQKDIDLLLYSVGWYGPAEPWFDRIFPKRYLKNAKFPVVAANWAQPPSRVKWLGQGFSRIYDRHGKILNKSKEKTQCIIYADLPLPHKQ